MNDPEELQKMVDDIVGGRRGKPGAMNREIAEALIPIMVKYKGTFGTKDQVRGCAMGAAQDAISNVIWNH